ncbi:hypothetical protein MUN89_20230 [Halobacillus salinarum]|uniref:DUF3784 domain-containing protein n=1 Tax=Halobacillus salinarum TaxID=2932257 RepID=A0ABY4EI58_9BACI|nr:hypothetical protein [Halobacillus salinarum]UOQ44155.1 hypothetical protein MUN89_20230 [Halobacillus salinarum]
MKVFLFFAGIVIIWTGTQIRKNKSTAFLTGKGEVFCPKNERKLAGRIGAIVMVYGFVIMVSATAIVFHFGMPGWTIIVLTGAHLAAVLIVLGLDQV